MLGYFFKVQKLRIRVYRFNGPSAGYLRYAVLNHCKADGSSLLSLDSKSLIVNVSRSYFKCVEKYID